jgi:hypothetical protein
MKSHLAVSVRREAPDLLDGNEAAKALRQVRLGLSRNGFRRRQKHHAKQTAKNDVIESVHGSSPVMPKERLVGASM